jgi:hypothetical protein
MASQDRPAPATLLRRMNERGGVARLVAALLAYGIDDHGNLDPDRLHDHLQQVDDRTALNLSTEILKASTVEPEYGPATMAMIDATLETLNDRDPRPLARWVDAYRDYGEEVH